MRHQAQGGCLLAATAVLLSATTDAFLLPASSSSSSSAAAGSRQAAAAAARARTAPLASSYYDNYDAQAARNKEQDRPDWAGGGLVSNLVSALINNKFLYGFMKIGARKVLIDNAEKKGVAWRDDAATLMGDARLQRLFDEKYGQSHASMDYPWYYTQPFHAYDEGNLNWLAAAEVESATSAMCLRVWPKDSGIGAREAQDRLRRGYQQEIQRHIREQQSPAPTRLLDVGCSAGISTRYLKQAFPEAKQVTGLDLSPHFLSVARLREQEEPMGIQYMHAKAEATGLSDASYDVAALTFIVHELPSAATKAIATEMFRVLTPGGTIAITDNDPRSPVIQRLPKPIAMLMKSTEPFSDEYFSLDIESLLQEIGFTAVETVASDPRHRTILATKPKA